MRDMSESQSRYAPGRVRDAIFQVLSLSPKPLSIKQIQERVSRVIGSTPTSSVRSYLRLNTPHYFVRQGLGVYSVHGTIRLEFNALCSTRKHGSHRNALAAPSFFTPIALIGWRNKRTTAFMQSLRIHLTDYTNTLRNNKRNSEVARGECGVFRHRLTATSGPHFLVSRR